MALVTRVPAGGFAHTAGVAVGDYVVALNGRHVTDYDEFMALFAVCPRPVRLTVRRFSSEAPEPAGRPPERTEDAAEASSSDHRAPEEAAPRAAPHDAELDEAPREAPAADGPQANGSGKKKKKGRLVFSREDAALPALRRPGAAAADDDDATFEVFVSRDGPLGVTMNKEAGGGRATMERVAPGGLAAAAGVKAGDLVLRVGDAATPSYDDALRAVRGADAGRPLRLLLRRGAAKLTPTAATLRFVVSAHEGSFRTRATNSFRDGDDGANEDEDDAWASRHALPEARPDDLEFDCDFDAGPLGMRIEERVGLVSVTVVTDVAAGGQAHRLGVKVGCTLLGFNGERYLSHAHAAAVLQHGKRPVAVRLRFAD
ncbi:hypothetical protein M885DRAFT_549627 [Pelagophyceae sp. CCMP2097]|nr:hypothetical protein M885DRAFT_549627 [Pelagophyceae sp. CCMP2097]